MEQSKIDMFVMQHNKHIAAKDMMIIRQRLEQMNDDDFIRVSAISFKNPTITLVFAWFLGAFGVDGFYCGKIGLGVAKLLLWILYMIFYIIFLSTYEDCLAIIFGIIAIAMFVLFLVSIINGAKWTRRYNFKKFMEAT